MLPQHIQLTINDNNDTELHQVLRNGTFNQIKTFLDKTSDKLLSKMARMLNNENLLPLHELGRNQNLEERQKRNIVSRIIAYSTNKVYKKISEPIDAKNVLQKFKVSEDRPKLRRNIELGCKLANEVRAILKNSPTHPRSNACTRDEKESIILAVEELRWKTRRIFLNIRHLEVDEKTKRELFIEQIAKAAIASGHFSCQEAAEIAQYFLQEECKQLKEEIPSEILRITKGDHALLAIDYPGPDAVLCDPWGGKVMPDTQEAKERSLKGHFTIFQHRVAAITGVKVALKDNKESLEMLTFFNPTINKTEVHKANLNPPRINFCRLFAACVVGAAVGVVTFMAAQNTMQRPE